MNPIMLCKLDLTKASFELTFLLGFSLHAVSGTRALVLRP